MIYDKLVKILDEATIFDFDAGQRVLSHEWIISISFHMAGILLFVFNPNKELIDVKWSNV